jgi:hypothetical protein
LVFHTAWEVANREARITTDKVEVKEEGTENYFFHFLMILKSLTKM